MCDCGKKVRPFEWFQISLIVFTLVGGGATLMTKMDGISTTVGEIKVDLKEIHTELRAGAIIDEGLRRDVDNMKPWVGSHTRNRAGD